MTLYKIIIRISLEGGVKYILILFFNILFVILCV